MKKLLCFGLVLLQLNPVFSQFGKIDTVDCTPSQYIITTYLADAQTLALRQIFVSQDIYKDSVQIPSSHYAPILRDLQGIYEAGLPQITDSIFNIYNIHTYQDPDMTEFDLSVDTNYVWVKNWLATNLVSGNDTIDLLMSKYNLIMQGATIFIGNEADISIWTGSYLNLAPLEKEFKRVSGVLQASDGLSYIDGSNITMNDSGAFKEYIFTFAFGDCPSGCMGHHSWKFRVYPGCLVEYMRSFGTPLPLQSAIEEVGPQNLFSVFPNPSNGTFSIRSSDVISSLKVSDILGQTLAESRPGISEVQFQEDKKGIYFLTVTTDKGTATQKLFINY
ncbi:MAG: hypothetical protein JWO06_4034 [Bacteroidota bacterium]|nr:hypothetical protein [Bacteroidota bacterium]